MTRQFSASDELITPSWLDARERIAKTDKNHTAVTKMEQVRGVYLTRHREQKSETLNWIRNGRLKAPTLIIWGLNDPSALISSGYALFEIIANIVPRSQLHVFGRSGHYSYREHPNDFVRVVTEFVKAS